ncbi:MAG: outer membrane protein assembly factor BamD [Coxiellaceae bacterium]|nr:outer membrane protein assembly factor BamD [Coxiellaceae bacterium]
MKKLFLLILLGLLVAGCSGKKDPYASYRTKTAAEIYHGAHTALVKKHYADAVDGFEALDAIYPFGPYAQRAQLQIIYAYYKNGDLPSAVTAADRYVRLYPRGKHIDYAYYMRGVISQSQDYSWMQRKIGVDPAWRDLTSPKHAFLSFSELVNMYPNSKYTPDALLRMRYLRNVIAEHSLEIANYYYNQKAYVAAANRASYIVEHFSGTLATPDALALMVKSYRHLHLNKLAHSSYLILQASYPHSKAFSKLA